MDINEETAKKLWRSRYGNEDNVKDFTGKWMYFYDYGKQKELRESKGGEMIDYGWNIHHMYPQDLGGTDNKNNLEIVHWETNASASNKTTYTIDGITYRVRKLSNGHYGIFNGDDRVDFTIPNS
jgi:hypothetical protein